MAKQRIDFTPEEKFSILALLDALGAPKGCLRRPEGMPSTPRRDAFGDNAMTNAKLGLL